MNTEASRYVRLISQCCHRRCYRVHWRKLSSSHFFFFQLNYCHDWTTDSRHIIWQKTLSPWVLRFVMATVTQKCTLYTLYTAVPFVHCIAWAFRLRLHTCIEYVSAYERWVQCVLQWVHKDPSDAFGRGTAVLSYILFNSSQNKWFVIATRSFLQAVKMQIRSL